MNIPCSGLAWIVAITLLTCQEGESAVPALAVSSPVAIDPSVTIATADAQARAAEARGDSIALVKALNDEANGYLRSHKFDAAEKLLLRILHEQERRTGSNSLAVSDALLSLGWFYNNLAHYEAAQDALDRCRDIRERLLGTETVPVAEVLNALGDLEENRGNLTLAEAFYQQAIAIQQRILGPESPVTANTWNNLATLYWITGDYAAAQKYFTQALAVREKVVGPDSLAVATTLNNLALLAGSLGDYDDAESTFQRVLKIRTTRLGADHPLTVTTLSQLGMLYVREGDDARAEPLLVRAVELREKTYAADHPDVARSLMQLALLYDRQKQFRQAEPLLVKALEIRRRTVGTDHPEYAASLAALAQHDHQQGRLVEALPLYEQALQIVGDALGQNHPDALAIASNLSYLKLDLNQRDGATELASQVADAQQAALNGVFTFSPERQRMDFEKTMSPCDLPAALGDADLVAQVVLRTKGVVLDSLLEDEAVTRAERDPAVLELMEKKRLLAAQLLQAQGDASGTDFSDSPDTLAHRQVLEKEEHDLEVELAGKGIGSGKIRRALATNVADVQDALPADAALVEFVAYNRYTGRLSYEPAYGAVVLTKNGPSRWLPLGGAADIETRVRTCQKYMRRRVREAVLSQALRGLEEALCEPVQAVLPAGIHRLIISPDGILNFVSFATLLDAQDHFFGEDFELHYVSSGRDLLDEKRGVPDRRTLVIFANPSFDRLPDTDAPRAASKNTARYDELHPALPGTDREANLLQDLARGDGFSVQLYRGGAASKGNLVRQESPGVLHLATHGLYLSEGDIPDLPDHSSPSPSMDSVPGKAPVRESMNRSVLALAGAAVTLHEWRKGNYPLPNDDGLLTAREVAGLNLDQTWLVTLSACDTGTGEAQPGEGVLGLRRGFAEAGAQNVLTTLWTVDDNSTADLMGAFYREALRTGDAPGALAQVQRASLQAIRQKSGLFDAVHEAGPFVLVY